MGANKSERLTKVKLYPWHHPQGYPCSSMIVLMRDCSSRRTYDLISTTRQAHQTQQWKAYSILWLIE